MRKEIEIQQENINELIKLASENPELKIMPMVDNDICCEDYSYTLGNWGNAEIDEYYCVDDRIYFRSSDKEELINEFVEKLDANLSDEEAEKIAEDKFDKLPWDKVIVVYINSL